MKIDKCKVSRDLAKLMREGMARYRIALGGLAQMTGLSNARIEQLSRGCIFSSFEIQVVAGALGITMDKIFPFDAPDRKTQSKIVRAIRTAGGGVAPFGLPSRRKTTGSPRKLQESLVRLQHYVQCLRAFR